MTHDFTGCIPGSSIEFSFTNCDGLKRFLASVGSLEIDGFEEVLWLEITHPFKAVNRPNQIGLALILPDSGEVGVNTSVSMRTTYDPQGNQQCVKHFARLEDFDGLIRHATREFGCVGDLGNYLIFAESSRFWNPGRKIDKDQFYAFFEFFWKITLSGKEGRRVFRSHQKIERNQTLVKAKKQTAITLSCEICAFDFEEAFGELGAGYIECHHKIPLHTLEEQATVQLEDLALVCANCHRMLHRRMKAMLSVENLRQIVDSRR